MQRVKNLDVVKEMEIPGDYIMMVLFGNYKNVLSRIRYFQIFIQYLHLTLKAPRKNASENVVFWSRLLKIIA